MAEAILAQLLADRGVGASVRSAGFLQGGHPVAGEAMEALGPCAARIAGHRSHTVTPGDLQRSDLVLGMTREHVREAVVLFPEAWDHTFTLKELVRRSEPSGRRGPDESLATWLAAAHRGRRHRDLLGAAHADDVADPMGGPPSAFSATARLLADLCWQLVDRIAPIGELGHR